MVRIDRDMFSAIESLHESTSDQQGKQNKDDRPFNQDNRLLLRPYLLQSLRRDTPVLEDVRAYGALHGRLHARLSRDIGAGLESDSR